MLSYVARFQEPFSAKGCVSSHPVCRAVFAMHLQGLRWSCWQDDAAVLGQGARVFARELQTVRRRCKLSPA